MDVDDLANEIRMVPGWRDLGAGELAEQLLPAILREAASRLRAPAVAEVEVKPLEWVPVEEWKRCSKERAPAFGGEYQIVMLDPDDDEPLPSLYFEIGLGAFMFRFEQGQDPMGLPGETCPRKFPSVEAAKAAAQADYERRIRSALRTGGSE